MRQELHYVGADRFSVTSVKKPDLVWVLWMETDPNKVPTLSTLVHGMNSKGLCAQLIDHMHDWNMRGDRIKLSGGCQDRSVWIVCEYEE